LDFKKEGKEMKKLVIFLILFILSMPAFAQDKSVLAENFSLIRNSRANNRAFFNSNIICPADYLFFNVNKRHPRQHRAFQILKSHRYSSRITLSSTAAVEDGRQNWRNKYNLIYGQRENINPEEKSESLAEGYLKRLAERSKRVRKTRGIVNLLGGGVLLVSGVVLLSSADEEDFFGGIFGGIFGAAAIASGAVLAGSGIYNLSIPSRAERELEDILSISDLAQRERAGYGALSSLAVRGRRRRIFCGIIWSAISAYILTREYGNFLGAGIYGAFAVYEFARKSRAERVFQSYLKEKEFQNRLEFRVGILSYGGVKVGFAYSF
jgi:hypothetical protein